MSGPCIEAALAAGEFDPGCGGAVQEQVSRSGCTVTARCERHQAAHDARLDALDAGLRERYPGWDNPHSPPPRWFDPAYAGEAW